MSTLKHAINLKINAYKKKKKIRIIRFDPNFLPSLQCEMLSVVCDVGDSGSAAASVAGVAAQQAGYFENSRRENYRAVGCGVLGATFIMFIFFISTHLQVNPSIQNVWLIMIKSVMTVINAIKFFNRLTALK